MTITATAARLYVRAHYVALLASVGIALGWYALHEHDQVVAARATVKLVTHQQDSVVRVYRDSLARSSAAVVHDLVTVPRYIERLRVDTLWLRDTLRVAGDTTLRVAVPLPVVQRADSTIRACSLLESDCAAFHRAASATISALTAENTALKARPERNCATPSLITGIVGLVGGAYLRGKLP